MAEIIPAILPFIGILGEYLANPIKKRVSYLCCYSCNVQGLDDEIPELTTKKQSVQQRVKAAKDNLEVILTEVESWLSKVDEVEKKSIRIRNDAAEVQKGCLSKWCPPLHYRLSREALMTTEASIKLRDTRFERIANPVNPADLPPIPATSVIGFESRDSIEDEIMDALKDDSVYLIGICGMGGIGKTTMVKKIEGRVREKTEDSGSLFEEVVMVVVSQQLDLPKVQKEIAKGLGLRDLEEQSPVIRARQLHARLKAAKSILIILDDVWETLNLEELGIPSQSTHARCKVILTSRDRNALTLMEDAKIFSLEVLNDEESWILFRKNAGNSIDSSNLHEIAKDVVKECNGLPLALEIVGIALIAKSKSYWEDSLLRLQKAIPTNIPEVLKGVYRPLLLSYNQLETEECRYLFLLCCLFPEDYHISLEALVRFGWGLGILAGVENLRQTRNRVKSIVENLINRSLLMESRRDWKGNRLVKMHDVIRDMGIWIASEGKHVFMISHVKNRWPKPKEDSYGDYTCISLGFSKGNIGIPERIKCSSLELLRVDFPKASQILPQNFFCSMTRLKVVEASGIKSLPPSIHLLNNLRTLHLVECKLEMISIIGELINLEILSLIYSDLKVLPEEIGRLRKLSKLEIIQLSGLRSIAFGVLSRLVQLEELVISPSFRSWEAEEKEKAMKNATLAELHSLNHLTTLHIEISDPNAIPKKMPLRQKLTNYTISVGEVQGWASRYQKAIEFKYKEVTPLEDWLCDMVGDAEYLVLEAPICRNVVKRLVRLEYKNLKEFKLCKCSDVQFLIYPFAGGQQNRAFFPILKKLNIEDSCSLQEISNGSPPAGSFKALEEIRLRQLSGLMHLWTFTGKNLCLSNLKDVKISNCGSLLYVFPFSMAESLSELERLEVSDCQVMKEIFKKEEGEVEITINKIKFPKLWYLNLKNLPSLCGFCNGIDTIEAPALRKLFIADLPSTTIEGNHDVHQQLLFDQQVAGNSFELYLFTPLRMLFNLSRLQTLKVESIHNLRSLFSPSILNGLTNLKELCVNNCSTLEEVIGKGENVGEAKTKRTLFPQLRRLELSRLPKILALCHSMGDLELPLLEILRIEDCPMMEIFVKGISKHAIQSFFSKKVFYTKLKILKLNNLNIAGILFHNEVAGNSLEVCNFNFSGLQTLEVKSIHNFKSLFSPSILGGFTNLQSLIIKDCATLEEVIGKEENVGETKTMQTLFPQLKNLTLSRLPKILAFCHNMGQLELPSLEQLYIEDCPLMETFVQGLSKHIIEPFFSKEVWCTALKDLKLRKLNIAGVFGPSISIDNFCGLEDLRIISCHKMSNLFSPPSFRGLTNIKELYLEDCEELQEVIAKEDDQEGPTSIKETLSPHLKYLNLRGLPKMQRFCHMNDDLEFTSLERVFIDRCPMLEIFSPGQLQLPSFKRLAGLLDLNLAAKIFFKKEKSSDKIQSENNCFTLSARDLDIQEGSVDWLLERDSSDSFVTVAELRYICSLEIRGKFETLKLLPGVVYEIIFIIMLEENAYGWEEALNLKLTLPGGIAQHRTEILDDKPREEWIEILVGEFTREPHQIGELKFSLSADSNQWKVGLRIKGVRLRVKG